MLRHWIWAQLVTISWQILLAPVLFDMRHWKERLQVPWSTDPCVYVKLRNIPPRVKLQGPDSWIGMNDSLRSVELRELRMKSICLAGFTDRQVDSSISTAWASCRVSPIVMLDVMVSEIGRSFKVGEANPLFEPHDRHPSCR
jgi:hypothetical protein